MSQCAEKYESISDAQLIINLQSGSLDALGIIYDRHRGLVFRTAIAITGDSEAAADLLQDVFLRLYRFAGHIDPLRPLEPWLYRMTTNLSYTWVKRRQRWLRPLEDVADWLASTRKDTPAYQAELDDSWRQVQQAVLSLPLSHRGVVVLYYVNDLSLQEISEILDIPVGTVKSRLHYGRQALKQSLGLIAGDILPDLQYEFT
ncbi:MAG TPA: RNA polymerase sigma factor [Anaerolineales bacterium]|nr:RNA polymerase sigma factor [Anaerolineales bacterium]